MSEPAVSLLVPVYNSTHYGADYLPKLLQSIQAQAFGDFEVLIGDDASTDGTIELVQPFLSDVRFRLFRETQNRGLHHNLVSLLEKARGQFWCPPGQDDILHPQFLEKRIPIFMSHPSAVVLHGAASWIDENGKPYVSDFTRRVLPELNRRLPASMSGERMLRILLQHNIVNWPSALVRMDATRRVLPYFTPRWVWAMDWMLWMLLAANGGDFLWDSEPLMNYRMHKQSISGSPQKEAVRQMERKLAPLYTLSVTSAFSARAKTIWLEQRLRLYRWWLITTVTLKRKGVLKQSDLLLAAAAFHGTPVASISLAGELFRHGIPMIFQYGREKFARRRQIMQVSGLSLIDDPLFQKS
ncbi:MAG TPA: glycosyltransferase [Verrucomicrobiae bacterium]|nr:glycosyltransferase [Verrucomicrobiae bacterium]